MPYRNALNSPYNLLTPHGRAQSYAYSAQGAALAEAVEFAIEQALDKLTLELEELIDTKMLDVATDMRADEDLEHQLTIFQSELGCRDRREFEPMLTSYKEERHFRNANFDKVVELIKAIRKTARIED